MSSLNLSQQSSLSHQNSLDSTGEPPGCQTSLQGGQQIVMATQPQMQTVFSQQGPTAQVHSIYFLKQHVVFLFSGVSVIKEYSILFHVKPCSVCDLESLYF